MRWNLRVTSDYGLFIMHWPSVRVVNECEQRVCFAVFFSPSCDSIQGYQWLDYENSWIIWIANVPLTSEFSFRFFPYPNQIPRMNRMTTFTTEQVECVESWKGKNFFIFFHRNKSSKSHIISRRENNTWKLEKVDQDQVSSSSDSNPAINLSQPWKIFSFNVSRFPLFLPLKSPKSHPSSDNLHES